MTEISRLAEFAAGRSALVMEGHVEAESAFPGAPRIRADSLEALDRGIARHRPALLVAEIPARGGRDFVDPRYLVRLVRSTRAGLAVSTDLSDRECPFPAPPDAVFHRRLVPGPLGRRSPLVARGERPAGDFARAAARERDAAACLAAARILEAAGLPVLHLGLPSHPMHKIARRSLGGYGSRLHLEGGHDPAAILGLLAAAGFPPAIRVAASPRAGSTALDFADPGAAA